MCACVCGCCGGGVAAHGDVGCVVATIFVQGGAPVGAALKASVSEGNTAVERFTRQDVVTEEISAALLTKDSERLRTLLEVRADCAVHVLTRRCVLWMCGCSSAEHGALRALCLASGGFGT